MTIQIPDFLDFKNVIRISESDSSTKNNFTKIKIIKIHTKAYHKTLYVTVLLNDKFQICVEYDPLSNLILNSTIINGELNCNCKIVIDNKKALLLDINSEQYSLYKLKSTSTNYIHKNIIGDMFTQNNITYFVYLGKIKYQKDNARFDSYNNFLENTISQEDNHLLLCLKVKDLNKPFKSFFNKTLEFRRENFSFLGFMVDKNCIKMNIPEDYKKIIADYYSEKASNTIKKIINKEYKEYTYISGKINKDIALANINGGTKSITDFMIFS